MKITAKAVASLSYTLEADGILIGYQDENNPLEYIHGTNTIIAPFEAAAEGKEPGDEFVFTMPFDGRTLEFKCKVLNVREATEKELTEGLHGEFLPHEGCCGHHGGGCCGKHHHDGEPHECCGHHHGEDHECCHHHNDGEDHECCCHK